MNNYLKWRTAIHVLLDWFPQAHTLPFVFLVGRIDLKHHIDHPILGTWGGHMGYTVCPSERGKGYAKEMLRLNLENCRKRNMDKVLITCDWDNPASEKTILVNGGVFEKEVTIDDNIMKRYWVTL